MKSFAKAGLLVGFLLSATAICGDKNDMQPFPAAEEGFERMVFRVPTVEDEAARKVEIIVGRTLLVDCNQQWYGGDLDERVVEGWGYTYLVLEKVRGPASTRMACPPGEEKREVFVGVRGHGFLQRYNSKLPFVVYVPEGFEVRYRIWATENEINRAQRE